MNVQKFCRTFFRDVCEGMPLVAGDLDNRLCKCQISVNPPAGGTEDGHEQLFDDLMKKYKNPDGFIGENGLLKQLAKRLLERAMQAELTEHLGYGKHAPIGRNSGNSRNGGYNKTITGDSGKLEVTTPRDRNPTFNRSSCPNEKPALLALTTSPSRRTGREEPRNICS